ALEVRQRAGPEVVAHGRDLVQPLPFREVFVTSLDDLDARLLRLLDVAAPQLVEVLVDLFQGPVRQGHLVDVARLDVTESGAAVLALLPAHAAQLVGDLEGARFDEVGLQVAQTLHVRVLDALLDRRRLPAAADHRGAHLHREGALLLQVSQHWLDPFLQIRREPVDDRALGQVGEVALDLGELPVEDEAGPDHLAGPLVEPAEVLRAPFRLDVRPGRDLHVTRRRQALDVCQMLLSTDGPQGQAHSGRSSGWCVPMGSGAPALARSLLRPGSGPVGRTEPPPRPVSGRGGTRYGEGGSGRQSKTPPNRPPCAMPRKKPTAEAPSPRMRPKRCRVVSEIHWPYAPVRMPTRPVQDVSRC